MSPIERLAADAKNSTVSGHAVADDLGISRDDPGAELFWALKTAEERRPFAAGTHFGGAMSLEYVTIRVR